MHKSRNKKIAFLLMLSVLFNLFMASSIQVAAEGPAAAIGETGPLGFAVFSGSDSTVLDLSGRDRNINGNVHSNNNVVINAWNLTITGFCQAVGKILEHSINNKIVQRIEGVPKLPLPDMFANLKKKAVGGGKVLEGDKRFSQERIDCSGIVYIKGNVVLDNCTISGSGAILAEGNITLIGNNKYVDDSSKTIFYTNLGNIDVRGTDHEVDGVLYAPAGKIIFNGAKQAIKGKVIGKELVLNNRTGFSVVYEESSFLDDLLMPEIIEVTDDTGFDDGTDVNISHDVPNQIQLDDTVKGFNFIWVAVSSKGTVVKIDTDTGKILGEYWTSPQGQPKNPSRTTVDLNGNVWCTNRDGNSVLRIGLAENGQWIDKNGNGVCDTSTGLGDIRPWSNGGGADTNGGVSTAQDECIITYTRVSSGGTRHVSVDKNNDVWVSGTGNRIFDLLDGVTGKIKRTEPSVGYGGYGGLIDKNGVIWSSNPLLRWDTSKPLSGANGGNWIGYSHDSYGLALDKYGNVWNTAVQGNIVRKFAPNGTLIGTYNHGADNAQGCVADRNGDIWVAHSLLNSNNTVGHLKNDGTFVGNVTVGSGPTGVAVDAKGMIWATNYNSGTVSRIDPAKGGIGRDGKTPIGQVDLTTVNLGGNPYDYSDMTGSTLIGSPKTGTWTTVLDSGMPGTQWGTINWNGTVYSDGELSVSVSSSEDKKAFSSVQNVSNDGNISIPDGRYIKVSVNFKRSSDDRSPVLYDLAIHVDGYIVNK